MLIRSLTIEDNEAAVALMLEWEAEKPIVACSGIDAHYLSQLFQLYVLNGAYFAWVAESDGDIVGILAGVVTAGLLNPSDVVAYQHLWYVKPEHRVGTIGPRLLREFERWAKARHANYIAIGANHGFDPERVGAFYAHCGYTEYETHYLKEAGDG